MAGLEISQTLGREMDGNIRREIFPLVLEGKFGLNLVSVLNDATIF